MQRTRRSSEPASHGGGLTRWQRVLTAGVVTTVVAATWIGAGTSAASQNACGLLTKAQVAAAIGEPVGKVQGSGSATGAVFCSWYGTDKRKGITLIAASDSLAARYKGYVSLLTKPKALPGVGVAAVSEGDVIVARNSHRVIQIGELYRGFLTLAVIKPLAVKALAHA